jgi:hypothetical protein
MVIIARDSIQCTELCASPRPKAPALEPASAVGYGGHRRRDRIETFTSRPPASPLFRPASSGDILLEMLKPRQFSGDLHSSLGGFELHIHLEPIVF